MAVLLLALALDATAKTKPTGIIDGTPSALYEDALSRLDAGDVPAATIQLKNALQRDPNYLPARIALGQVYLRQGQAASTEKELRIALAMGAAADQVLPTLGNALLMQRKYEEILLTIRSKDPAFDGGFEVQLLRGRAHYQLGHLDEAESAFARARQAEPNKPEPLVGLALVALARSDIATARSLVDDAIGLAPQDAESWYQKGEILRAAGDDTGAMAAVDKALDLNPRAMRARLSRAALSLAADQLEQARADAEFVREANPDDIMAPFLLWQILARAGDHAGATAALTTVSGRLNEIAEEALNKEPMLLRIAALISYSNRDLSRTEQYLDRFMKLNPRDQAMQRLYGRVKLLLGDPKAAIAHLYPLHKQNPTDREALLGLGQAYLQIGNYSEASAILQEAAALQPNDPLLTGQLALSQIGSGDWNAAIGGLRDALKRDQPSVGTGMLLAILQFKNGEKDEAVATAKALNERIPNNPRVLNLLGIFAVAQRDDAAARKNFELALRAGPRFSPPAYNLAKLELATGDVAGATKRLEALVERNPKDDSALMTLADIAAARHDPQAAARWLEKAASAAPDAIETQVQLVDTRLLLNQIQDARTAAQTLIEQHPENAAALEAFAKVKMADGKIEDAKRSFRNAVHYASFDGPLLIRIARQQVKLEDYAAARLTLLKAMKSNVNAEATVAMIRMDIQLGNDAAAASKIQDLKASQPNSPISDILAGELHVKQRAFNEAIVEFRAAQTKVPTTDAMLGLVDALTGSGKIAEALILLETWTLEHPDDIDALDKLARAYIAVGKLDKARPLHERLLASRPNDVVVMANLARIYQLQGDKRARRLAEQAVEFAPNWAVALDTLGWIMVTGGETANGLELLRQAISRESNPLTRYHLAQALHELGRTAEAKTQLRQILKTPAPAGFIKDVQRYYDALAAEH